MVNYYSQLKNQADEIDRLLKKAEKRLSKKDTKIDGSITYSKRKSGYQYYLLTDEKRSYIKKENMDIVQYEFQMEYDNRIKDILMEQKAAINRFLSKYNVEAIQGAYTKLNGAKKVFVNPLAMTDEQYAANWKKLYEGNANNYPKKAEFITNRGESVRSKSEKIIADMFEKYGVIYSYEPKLEISEGKYVFPDFAILDVKNRKTIFWEHLGIIDDGEYASKNLAKIREYEAAGFELGEDLIITMESQDKPLDTKEIRKKISKYIQ